MEENIDISLYGVSLYFISLLKLNATGTFVLKRVITQNPPVVYHLVCHDHLSLKTVMFACLTLPVRRSCDLSNCWSALCRSLPTSNVPAHLSSLFVLQSSSACPIRKSNSLLQ
jgi:hypothetical protein